MNKLELHQLKWDIEEDKEGLYSYIADNYFKMEKEELKEWVLNILYIYGHNQELNDKEKQIKVIDEMLERDV